MMQGEEEEEEGRALPAGYVFRRFLQAPSAKPNVQVLQSRKCRPIHPSSVMEGELQSRRGLGEREEEAELEAEETLWRRVAGVLGGAGGGGG